MHAMIRDILFKTLQVMTSRSEAYNDVYRVLFSNASSQALFFKSLKRKHDSHSPEDYAYIETLDHLLSWLPAPTPLQRQEIVRQRYRFAGWREGLKAVLDAHMNEHDVQEEISDLEHKLRYDTSPRMKPTSSVYISAVGRLEAYRYCLMQLKNTG